MALTITLIAIAYLLGSVPFALVIGKGLYGVDVRQKGSGNTGTTNVFRVLGTGAGILVFIGDAAKGLVPVLLARALAPTDDAALVAALAAGAAIAGHNWSIFLKGKGGKGVATGGGAIIGLMPWLFFVLFAIFWVVLLVTRYVSVSSLAAALSLSVLTVTTGQPLPYIVFAFLGTAVIIYAHRSNISRLARGEESRVSFPWNRQAAAPKAGPGGEERS